MDTGHGEKPCPICGNLTFEDVTELATVKAENKRLRDALITHRIDLHRYSTRPCPTCRKSAEALGISNTVPNTCADRHQDRIALEASND